MKRKNGFLIFLLFPLLLCANVNPDSLKKIVRSGPDTARLMAWEHLSNYYMSRDFDSSLLIYKEGSELAGKLQKAPQMNLFPTNLATIYYQKGEFEKAVFYFLEALKISENYKDTARIAQTLNNLGIINMYSGENEKALEYLQKAKIIKQQLKNNALTIAFTNMNIGIVYKNLENYEQAYEYFMKALPEIEKSQKKSALAPIYNNIGIIFLFRKQYEKALEYYFKAEIYADDYLPAYSRAVLFQNIGECYLYLKNPKKAFSYLDKGLQIAAEKGNLHVQKTIYSVMCDYYIDMEDYRNAYQFRDKYEILKDSLLSLDKKKMIEELQTKYETEKKEQQNLILSEKIRIEELETLKQKNISRLLILIVSLIFTGAMLLVYFTHRIKKINNKLQKSTQDLNKVNVDLKLSNDQTEAALGFKTQFIANMSHEIRTPLNIIIGFNSMLKKNITDPKLQSFIEAIEVSSNNLLQLLNDILDLSKMEAGKMMLNPDSVNLTDLLGDIHKLFVIRAQEKDIDFTMVVEPNVPKGLVIDEARLRQILLNLIGNAIKFTETGFVKLRVFVGPSKPGYITYTSATDLIFEIEDSGIGISEKDQTEIFESFKQIKIHNQKTLGGTGLGLPISKRLTEMMGGKIMVSSEIGKGSKFAVYYQNIPIVQLDSANRKPPVNITELTDIIYSKGCLIIADDEDLNRSLIRACFENTQVEIIEAQNGEEAVAMALKYNPNLILMDLKMPVKNGFDAAIEIKNDSRTKLIPIFAFSASHQYGDKETLDKKLFDGFISKPVMVTELYEEVSRFIPHTRKSATEAFL